MVGISGSKTGQQDVTVSDSSSTVADDRRGVPGSDYLPFIWQKLDAIDSKLNDISEKYGKLSERTENINQSLRKIEEDTIDLKSTIKSVKIYSLAIVTIIGLIIGLYQLLESHITIALK